MALTEHLLVKLAESRGIDRDDVLRAAETLALALGGGGGGGGGDEAEEAGAEAEAGGTRKRPRVAPSRAHVLAALAEIVWRAKSAGSGVWLSDAPLEVVVCRKHFASFGGRPGCLHSLARAVSRQGGCPHCGGNSVLSEFASESQSAVSNLVASLQ